LRRNRQTEAYVVLRPKRRNRRGDFETQIAKPELPVLRPKSGNPPPPWFWGSTKKPTAGFEAKPGETVATSFEAKLEKTVTAGFEAKPFETVATGFEAKRQKSSEWFWGQTTHKPSPSVLRPKPMRNRPSGFEAKPLTNHRPWF
jgi:hypothetical protein